MTHSEMLDYLDRDRKLIANVRTMQKTEDDLEVCDGIAEAVEAAIAALTPRVLALDEIMGHDGALFVEDRIRMAVYPVLYIAEHRPDARMATWWGIESYGQDGYGDWWRCWTRRPTPEDMAREPWQAGGEEEE